MKLPWQKKQTNNDQVDSADDTSSGEGVSSGQKDQVDTSHASELTEPSDQLPKGYTPPKGKPTPKRREQEIARGVRRDPKGASAATMRQRRKELKQSMSKQEWKEYKREERAESMRERKKQQQRMDAGDERYLLARDQGEVRRYARDWVDSRAFLNNWVMVIALFILASTFIGMWNVTIGNIASLIGMVIIVILAIEGIFLARSCNKAVRKKFPETTETGFKLGFYAYSRAIQPRKWRSPKPRVDRNDTV